MRAASFMLSSCSHLLSFLKINKLLSKKNLQGKEDKLTFELI